jgi:hypothetical protein
MSVWRLLTLSFLAVWALPTAPVEACSCMGPGKPCEAFWRAESVFIGTVASIDQEMVTDKWSDRPYPRRVVSFDAVTVTRGPSDQPMRVRTGFGGGDCGYTFNVGQSYVVYTHRDSDGRLATSICTRTAPLERAVDDLSFIRGLPPSSPKDALGWLTGDVRRLEQDAVTGMATLDERATQPIRLTLTGRQRFVIDSQDGRFDGHIPPGKYKVEVSAPAGFYAAVWPKELFLADARGCATVGVRVSADGRISGQVLDARGAAVAGIGVHAVPAGRARRDGDYWSGTSAITDDDGRFVIAELGQGEYLVGPHLVGAVRNAATLRTSLWVTVKLGLAEREELDDLRLPEGLELGAIQGTVLGPDGAPRHNAWVSLGSANADKDARFDSTRTDERGRFTLAAIAGRRYAVIASHSESPMDDEGRRSHVAAEAKTPTPVLAGESVTLTLRPLTKP